MQNMNVTTKKTFDISAAALHILAMTLMLMDHLWATLLPAQEWLTCAPVWRWGRWAWWTTTAPAF